MANTSFGMQLCGTFMCGLVFALPIVLGYFIVKEITRWVQRSKAKAEKSRQVITT